MIHSAKSLGLLLFILMLGVKAGWCQGTTTISFSIPSQGTGLNNLIFHQIVEGVILHSKDSTIHWQLYQKSGNQWVPKPSQVTLGQPVVLFGLYQDLTTSGQPIEFRWKQEKGKDIPGVRIQDNGKAFQFLHHDSLLLSYRYAPMPVPVGISEKYERNGFVHPIRTPNGNTISRIQPPDHYHHYGLWHPWTHTEYKGEEIDFWNLNKGQGTVRFSDVVSRSEGPLFSEITVVHDHVIQPGRGEQTVLKELLTYRLWTIPDDQEYFILDVIYRMNPATDHPLTIKTYRYQGFSLRGPAHWSDDNVNLRTSEGKDKSNGNASRARWMKVTGPGDKSSLSTVVFMTHPANYNFPELIRIWPTGTNGGKENVFINFNPTQDRDWVMEPGKEYSLQYRVLVADIDFTNDHLNQLWSSYAGRAHNESRQE